MEDHDQRLKSLLKRLCGELFEMFFPAWAKALDFSAPEWLDKELFPDPPAGHRRTLDLLAKVPITDPNLVRPGDPAELLALVHIEVESADTTANARRQLWEHYCHLRVVHELPVLPVAVFLRVGLDGIGVDTHVETFGDLEVVTFRYLYVGLPRLDAVQYVEGEKLLGVGLTAFMDIPDAEATRLAGRAIERIAGSQADDMTRFLLAECIESYLPVPPTHEKLLETIMASSTNEGLKALRMTTFDRGAHASRLETAKELLAQKFGHYPPEVDTQLETMNFRDLSKVVSGILKAASLRDLGLGE